MKIAIVVNGLRGDVQPMLALAIGLIKNGHEVVCCAPPENEELVNRYQVQFVAFGPNYKEIFSKNAGIKGGATKSPPPKEMKRETGNQIDLLPGLLAGSDLVLGVGFVLGVHTVAEILKVPYRFVIFYPSILGPAGTDSFAYRKLFGFGRLMTNMVMKGYINKKRNELGLPPVMDVWADWMGDEVIVACDKELNDADKGVSFHFTQTGYMMLPSLNALPEEVESFINSGKPPVFIGFGSIPVSRPEKFGHIFNEVSKTTGQRLIVSRGWADLPENNSTNVLYVEEMPFELLFPRLAALVYHGGTGTMAAAARAGIPQVAFPFMADQFDNRKRIIKSGLGPDACDFKDLSEKALSSAINECIKNDRYKINAKEMAQKLKGSQGLELTIRIIESILK